MQTQTQTHTPWALCVGRLPCNILTGLQRSCFLLSTTNPSAVCLRASQNLLEESVTGSFTALMTNSISANHVCVYLPPHKKKAPITSSLVATLGKKTKQQQPVTSGDSGGQPQPP